MKYLVRGVMHLSYSNLGAITHYGLNSWGLKQNERIGKKRVLISQGSLGVLGGCFANDTASSSSVYPVLPKESDPKTCLLNRYASVSRWHLPLVTSNLLFYLALPSHGFWLGISQQITSFLSPFGNFLFPLRFGYCSCHISPIHEKLWVREFAPN